MLTLGHLICTGGVVGGIGKRPRQGREVHVLAEKGSPPPGPAHTHHVARRRCPPRDVNESAPTMTWAPLFPAPDLSFNWRTDSLNGNQVAQPHGEATDSRKCVPCTTARRLEDCAERQKPDQVESSF